MEVDGGMAAAAHNFYKTLQVDAEAEPEVIEAAYRRLARKYHPDVSMEESTLRMQALNEAYATLRDPALRAAYDAARVGARAPAVPSPPPTYRAATRPVRVSPRGDAPAPGMELSKEETDRALLFVAMVSLTVLFPPLCYLLYLLLSPT